MRLLADENFPGPLVRRLRQVGYDVAVARDFMAGAPDTAVLEHAQRDRRVLLTFDKDFGELAYRHGQAAARGVVLFRLTGNHPEEDNQRAFAAFTSRDDWEGHFSIVEDDRIRMRPLPERRP